MLCTAPNNRDTAVVVVFQLFFAAHKAVQHTKAVQVKGIVKTAVCTYVISTILYGKIRTSPEMQGPFG